MIVFSNTTPLIALSAIKQLDLLPQLFYKIYVVDTVVRELVPVTKLAVFSWILLYNIASPVTESTQYVFRKY